MDKLKTFLALGARAWRSFSRETRGKLYLSVALFLGVILAQTSIPILFATIISNIQSDSDLVVYVLAIYLALFFAIRSIEELRFAIYVSFEQTVQKSIALEVMGVFFRFPFAEVRKKSASEYAIIVDRGLSGVRAVFYNLIFSIGPLVIQTAILIIVTSIVLDLWLTVWIGAILAVFIVTTVSLSERTRKLQEVWFATASENYQILSEGLRAYETIRSFDRVGWLRHRYGTATDRFIDQVVVSLRPGIVLGFVQGVLLALLVGSATVPIVFGDLNTTAKVAALVLINGVILQIVQPLLQFSVTYRLFIQGLASAGQMLELVSKPDCPAKIPHTRIAGDNAFEIENLCVTEADVQILNLAHASIRRHGVTLIKGASGSGKTTLARCLAGLREYDGDVRCSSDIKNVFYMTQAVDVFNTSLAENVSLSPEPDGDRAKRALAQAGLAGKELSNLEQRPAGEGGAHMSGGQKRRIAIARMLYHDAEILIFDEPTNDLDKTGVDGIIKTIFDLGQDHTCIVISHDPRFQEQADFMIELPGVT